MNKNVRKIVKALSIIIKVVAVIFTVILIVDPCIEVVRIALLTIIILIIIRKNSPKLYLDCLKLVLIIGDFAIYVVHIVKKLFRKIASNI